MSDDLVKRLRNEATSRQGLERFDTLEDEAADRIEALEAENAALSEACIKWSEISQGHYQRAKGAEAERDALAEELEREKQHAEEWMLGARAMEQKLSLMADEIERLRKAVK